MFSWLIPRCVSLKISLYLTIFPPNVEMAGSALASRPHRRRRGRCARRSSVRTDGRWMSAPMSRGITHRIARNNHRCAIYERLAHGDSLCLLLQAFGNQLHGQYEWELEPSDRYPDVWFRLEAEDVSVVVLRKDCLERKVHH